MRLGRIAIIAVVVAAIGALFAFGLLRGNPDDRNITSNLIGKPAPAFALPLYERYWTDYGETFALDDHLGKPLVINFWASWCLPCYDEAPVLQQAWQAYGPQGVQFVGVQTQDRDKRDEGRAFIARFNLGFPNVLDNDSLVGVDWALYGVPETFFVDASGKVVAKHIGPVTPEVIEQQVGALLRGGA